MLISLLSRFSDNISSNYSFGLFIKLSSKQSCYDSWRTFQPVRRGSLEVTEHFQETAEDTDVRICNHSRIRKRTRTFCRIHMLNIVSEVLTSHGENRVKIECDYMDINSFWRHQAKRLEIKLLTSTRNVKGTNPGNGTRYFHKNFVFRSPSGQIAG